MIKKIAIFQNSTGQFGALYSMGQALLKACKDCLIDVRVFDTTHETAQEIYEQIEQFQPDITCGFNVILQDRIFYEPFGIVHLALIVDSCTYYPELLNCKKTIAGFVDNQSCTFFSSYSKAPVLHIPHAVDKHCILQEISCCRRDIDLLFLGSFFDSNEVIELWKNSFSKSIITKLVETSEYLRKDPVLSYHQAICDLVQENLELQKALKKHDISLFDLINSFELYTRGQDRIDIMKRLSKSFTIHVATRAEDFEKWKMYLPNADLRFIGPVPFDNLKPLLLRTRIVINSVPTIKEGFHERFFMSLASGASVLTNKTQFMHEFFPYKRAVVGIDDYMFDEIHDVLAHESERLVAVTNAQHHIKKYHTWHNRVDTLKRQLPDLIHTIHSGCT